MKPRVLWLVYLVLALVLLALLGYERHQKRDSIRVQEFNRMQSLARVTDANLGAHLESIDRLLFLTAQRLSTQGMPRGTNTPAWTGDLKFDVETTPGVLSVSIMDAAGTYVATSREALLGNNYANRPYFAKVRDAQGDSVIVSEPFLTQLNIYSVLLLRPVRDAQGRFLGAVTVSLKPTYFESVLSSVLYAPDLRCLLMHEDGVVFAAVGDFTAKPGANLSKSGSLLNIHKLGGLRETRLEAQSYSTGDQRFGVLRNVLVDKVPMDKHFVVAFTRNAEATYATWRRETYLMVAIALAVLASAGAGLLVWGRLQTQRSERDAQLQAEREAAALARDKAADEIADLYEHAPCGYHSLDARGYFVRINQTELDWFGLKREDVLGKLRFVDLLDAEGAALFEENFARFVTTGHLEGLEFRLARADGSILYAQASASAVWDANGNYLFSRTTLTDISERRRLISNLEASLKDQAAILDSNVAGFWITRGRTISRVNPVAANALGYEPLELVGQSTLMCYDSRASYDEFGAARVQAFAQTGYFHTQWQWRHKDGSLHWFDISAVPLPSDPLTTVWVSLSIDEIIQTKEQLSLARTAAEEANAAKSRFLATMSHELRTPLNAVLGMAQLLTADSMSQADRQHHGRIILSSGKSLLTLLNDILDFSKIEAGMLTLESIDFSAAQLLAEVGSIFHSITQAKGLELQCAWEGSATLYVADAHRVRQMLSNLVNNAIKFTPQGSIVVRGCELERDAETALLEFSVLDTGMGVPPEVMGELFQPFVQSDSSITRKFGGTGLGLSIVRSLAQAMGGDAGCENRAEGGARFWFRMRAKWHALAEHGMQPTASGLASAKRAALHGHVLVVEDDSANRDVAASFLVELGLQFTLANGGQEGLDRFAAQGPFSLVLMDVHMPDMDGGIATEQLRALEAARGLARTPVIGLSADVRPETRSRCIAAGMDGFISKPLLMDAFVACLRNWLPEAAPASIAPQAALPVPDLSAALQALMPLLRARKFAAHRAFQALQETAAGSAVERELSDIEASMAQMQFAVVEQRLQALAAQYQWAV